MLVSLLFWSLEGLSEPNPEAQKVQNALKPVPKPGATPPPQAPSQPPPPPGQPPTPPPPPSDVGVGVVRLDGVEICGDEPWFADAAIRRRLRESVAEAHKEQPFISNMELIFLILSVI